MSGYTVEFTRQDAGIGDQVKSIVRQLTRGSTQIFPARVDTEHKPIGPCLRDMLHIASIACADVHPDA